MKIIALLFCFMTIINTAFGKVPTKGAFVKLDDKVSYSLIYLKKNYYLNIEPGCTLCKIKIVKLDKVNKLFTFKLLDDIGPINLNGFFNVDTKIEVGKVYTVKYKKGQISGLPLNLNNKSVKN